MKRHLLYLASAVLLLSACGDNDPISDTPIDIHADYDLPQEGASQTDNDRIQALYDKYGCYFLYRFDIDSTGYSKDATWVQKTGTASQRFNIVMALGNPAYVGKMLDLLQKTWLQFFPDDFLSKGGIPYRVFLCDYQYEWRQISDWYQRIDHDYQFYGYSVTLAGLNAHLDSLTAQDYVEYKRMILPAFWDYYTSNGILDVPQEFYDLADYENEPEYPQTSEEAMEAYRLRGFLPLSYNDDGTPVEYWHDDTAWSMAKTYDLLSYMRHLRDWPYERIQKFLDNPKYTLIKQKYGILLNYYKENYGIDLRKMGDEEFQNKN